LSASGGDCSWELLHACNYRCPYCFFIPSWERAPEATNRAHHACSPGDWLAFWRRLRERRGEFGIELSGGEPFLYPDFTRLLAGVAALHRPRVITNLSWDPALARGLDPARVRFLASFHPHFAEAAEFERKLAALADADFRVSVVLVAYPPLFDRLPGLKARFESLGHETLVSPFQGSHEGRAYPEGYGAAQRAWLRDARPAGFGEELFAVGVKDASPRGRPCGAGSRYFRAYPDGSVWRCVSLKDAAGARPIGHIRDARLPLEAGPSPCPADACLCPAEYRRLSPAEAA
jgi:hypothetical protein